MATRADLRRAIGRVTGEVVVLTATDAGTASTFVDRVNLARGDGALVGRQLLITSAASSDNVGTLTRVSGNAKSGRSITLDPALPAATQVGDTAELWFERETGPTIDEVHDAINRVISSVSGSNPQAAVSGTMTFDALSPEIAIPATWAYFSGADWKGRDELWHPIPPGDLRIDIANQTVEVRNRARILADGQPIRLRGYIKAQPLMEDDDTTRVDEEWIVHQAGAQVIFACSHRMLDPGQAERKAQYLQTLADARRPKVTFRPRGGFVRLD